MDQAKTMVKEHWKGIWKCHRPTMSQADAEATAHQYIVENKDKWKHEEGKMVCPSTGRFSKT